MRDRLAALRHDRVGNFVRRAVTGTGAVDSSAVVEYDQRRPLRSQRKTSRLPDSSRATCNDRDSSL
jgi:hypothetical protein